MKTAAEVVRQFRQETAGRVKKTLDSVFFTPVLVPQSVPSTCDPSEKSPARISPQGAALASGIVGRVKNPVDTGFFTPEVCAARRPKPPLILHRLTLAKQVLPPRKRFRLPLWRAAYKEEKGIRAELREKKYPMLNKYSYDVFSSPKKRGQKGRGMRLIRSVPKLSGNRHNYTEKTIKSNYSDR